jgi:hypothetical protein
MERRNTVLQIVLALYFDHRTYQSVVVVVSSLLRIRLIPGRKPDSMTACSDRDFS